MWIQKKRKKNSKCQVQSLYNSHMNRIDAFFLQTPFKFDEIGLNAEQSIRSYVYKCKVMIVYLFKSDDITINYLQFNGI